MYDVIIIGAGASGAAIARELSRYQGKFCVLDKEADVCCGTSKANSGIVHAGFDAKEGSLMAKLNVEGSKMMEKLSKELDFPYQKNGSLVVCTNEKEVERLYELLERGRRNGVEELQILDRAALKAMEPNIADEAVAALYAPTGGIVCPFGLNIALAENAAQNGVDFCLEQEVKTIERSVKGGYRISTQDTVYETKVVVNAAGVYADEFHNMVSEKKLHITPRKGEYFLLDKTTGAHVSHTVFTLPGKYGKGVLVTPTVHGNLLIGPTATDVEQKEGTDTTMQGMEEICKKAQHSVKEIPFRQVITGFAGLRAHEDGHEFVIQEVEDAPGFIDCAGIESPGLTSAPAIGRLAAEIVRNVLELKENPAFCKTRKGILNPAELTAKERNELIRKNPAYGRIVCRCEMISEGEILDSIHRPLGATTMDGIKRRTRAGMGRCQAGFCTPKTMEILERELKIRQEEITKNGAGSEMIVGRNKDGKI